MARLIPQLDDGDLAEVASAAEREVYRACRRSLPDHMWVVHALELVARPPVGRPVDAEADFVVFDPDRGFLVVEVKGGGVDYDGTTRKWWSTDRNGTRHLIKDPVRQAKQNKYEILRHMIRAAGWGQAGAPRMLTGHAVLFPDLSDVAGLVAPGRPAEIVGGRSSLSDFGSWVDRAFSFWASGENDWQPLGERGMAVVDSLFCGRLVARALLATTIEGEHRRQIELTERQARVLRALKYHHRAAITGGAGTGKTLLAIQHAKTLAGQGLLTLLVCYNRPLADFLKREVKGCERVHAMSFHQLCDWRIATVQAQQGIDLLREAEITYPQSNAFDVHRPYALARSTELDQFRYQAIVVDEGQDFGEEYWLPIALLLEDEDSPLYVFSDPNQAVYRQAKSFPIAEPPFVLTENCRNTKYIHTAAYTFYEGDRVDPPEIVGEPVHVLDVTDLNAQARAVHHEVSRLVSEEKVRPDDVAVLVLAQRKDLYYRALKAAGEPRPARWSFEALWHPGTVLVDTARRFKGLEAAIVVLWGFEGVDRARDAELLYVALSRARSRVWVVGSSSLVAAILALSQAGTTGTAG